MSTEQGSSTPSTGSNNKDYSNITSSNTVYEPPTQNDPLTQGPALEPGQRVEELANNDGSISETFDIAFHDKAGIASNPEVSGSDRADYYEKSSQGKSDTEEEQDYLRNK